MRSYQLLDDSAYERKGLFYSLLGHGLTVLIALFAGVGFRDLEEPPVYSVTIEGGKTLGGRTQVAKDETKKTDVAPPKNVKEEEKKQEVKKEEVKIDPKKEEVKNEEVKNTKDVVIPKEKAKTEPTAKPKEAKKETKEDVNKDYQKALQRYLGNSSDARGQGFGAAKLGGTDMGGGEVRPREFSIYLETLKSKIKEGWTWYDSNTVLVATVEFSISANGDLSGERVVRSSGNYAFDESVLRAIRQANPVPVPPANVYQYFRKVTIIFDPRS